jgi:hypothetical protein
MPFYTSSTQGGTKMIERQRELKRRKHRLEQRTKAKKRGAIAAAASQKTAGKKK